MANKQYNPLSAYFRAPKLFTIIPSRGKFYTTDVVDMPESGELPIFAMTAKDEVIMKNPDALLNGEAVAQVIKSCVPNVKQPRKMLSSDVDVLLVAIQGATHGDNVEVSATCPKCNEETTGIASVEASLSGMAVLDDVYTVEYNGLEIEIRPFTYESTIKAGITNFQSTRSLQALANIDNEDERLKVFNENFVKIANLNFTLIIDSVAKVSYTDEEGNKQEVIDRDMITEFLENAESKVGKLIEEKIKDINAIGINHEMSLQCTNEGCKEHNPSTNESNPFVFTSKVNFDPVNFFTAS